MEKSYDDGGEELQQKLAKRLFKDYFENAKDPGNHTDLATAASDCGMGTFDELSAFLKSEEYESQVKKAFQRAAVYFGIDSVPNFVINETQQLVGSREPEDFARILGQVARGEVVYT